MIARLVTVGAFLLGLALLGLGVHCVLTPELAGKGYGVPMVGDSAKAYLVAAGMRDLVLGMVALALLWKHRSALLAFLVCLLVLPVADTVILLRHGGALINCLPHLLGIGAILVLTILAWVERN